MKSIRMKVGFLAMLLFYLGGVAQTSQPVTINAKIYPDSSGLFIYVKNVHIDFKFAGYGVYVPSDYPSMTSVPLENGERINFENIAEMTLRPNRVYWKKFIEPSQRHQFDDVGTDGYRYWSEVEAETVIKVWDGLRIQSRIQRPDYSDIYLSGVTDRGDFRLQVDQENGKTIRIEFEPVFIMQCSGDINHLYPNMQWKFCPICGSPLRRINKPITR